MFCLSGNSFRLPVIKIGIDLTTFVFYLSTMPVTNPLQKTVSNEKELPLEVLNHFCIKQAPSWTQPIHNSINNHGDSCLQIGDHPLENDSCRSPAYLE